MTTSVYVPLVLEAVEQLQAELVRIHHNVRAVAAWPQSSEAEIASIRACLRRASAVTRGIQDHVLELGGDGEADALRASSLRSRGIVIAIQLSELERAARGLYEDPPSRRFPDAFAFKDFVLGEVGRINASWIAEAKQDEASDLARERDLLARAEAAYAALGRDPDVAEFLAWGIHRQSFVFRSVCRVLAALLGVPRPANRADGQSSEDVPTLPSLPRHMATGNTNR
jgi:hypothetical protein